MKKCQQDLKISQMENSAKIVNSLKCEIGDEFSQKLIEDEYAIENCKNAEERKSSIKQNSIKIDLFGSDLFKCPSINKNIFSL